MPSKNLLARLAPALLAPVVAGGLVLGPGALPSALAATPAADSVISAATWTGVPEPMQVERRTVLSPPAWVAPVAGYRLTGQYGDVSGLWSSMHTGVDLAAPVGTPVRAVTGGVVLEAGYAGAYGNHTVVRLEDGSEIWYSHQDSILVSVGQAVSAGDVIGTVGMTGNVTGPHLHLEVRSSPETHVDPLAALAGHGLHL